MGTPENLNIRWDGFEDNLKVTFKDMREESEFFDVTLVAGDGKQMKASKVILAAGSSFFFNILKENPHPYPLIYLKGVSYDQLLSVLDFLYTGETIIAKEDLNQFMDIVEDLKVKGLTQTGLQTKSPRSAHGPLQSQGATEGSPPLQDQVAVKEPGPSPRISHQPSIRSTPVQCHEVTKEVAPSTRALHPPSGKDSDRSSTIPQTTYKDDNKKTSNVKVESCDAEHDNVSYRMNDHVSRLVNNQENTESKKNLKILGVNSVKNIMRDFYALPQEKQKDGMVLSDEQEQNDDEVSTGKKRKEELIDNSSNDDVVKTGKKRKKAQVIDSSSDDSDDGTPDEEQDFNAGKCPFCTKTFATSSELEKHKMSHTGGKPFKCPYCHKSFVRKDTLKNHIKTHTGKKLHKCLVCFKEFPYKSSLYTHEKMHIGEKKHQCLKCSKSFWQASHLELHRCVRSVEKGKKP